MHSDMLTFKHEQTIDMHSDMLTLKKKKKKSNWLAFRHADIQP